LWVRNLVSPIMISSSTDVGVVSCGARGRGACVRPRERERAPSPFRAAWRRTGPASCASPRPYAVVAPLPMCSERQRRRGADRPLRTGELIDLGHAGGVHFASALERLPALLLLLLVELGIFLLPLDVCAWGRRRERAVTAQGSITGSCSACAHPPASMERTAVTSRCRARRFAYACAARVSSDQARVVGRARG
jgi:hypothetical protein